MTLSFDRLSDSYDSTRILPKDTMEKSVWGIKKALRGNRTMVDIGIGTGRFARPLADSGFSVVGVDVSRSMMLKAREKGLGDLICAEAGNLPFRDRSFDAAIVIHVLHLIDFWRKAVREIGRVTRGVVISLIDRAEGFGIRDLYIKLRAEMGFPLLRLSGGEAGLQGFVQPARVTKLTEFRTMINVDVQLLFYQSHGSSISWDVPEEVHRKIIGLLRDSHGGKILERHDVIELFEWDPDELRKLK